MTTNKPDPISTPIHWPHHIPGWVQTARLIIPGNPIAPNAECLLFDTRSLDTNMIAGTITLAAPQLPSHAFLILGINPQTLPLQTLTTLAEPTGLVLYTVFTQTPDLHFTWLVHNTYNPIEHAQTLLEQNNPNAAYAVLDAIPQVYLNTPEIAAQIYAAMQYCLATAPYTGNSPHDHLERAFKSQVLFFRAISRAPQMLDPYITQAELWHRTGLPQIGLRNLRSYRHAYPASPIGPMPLPPSTAETPPTPPPYDPRFRPRILIIMNPDRPHFGLDILFDALCHILGPERVTDYPWKPTLHGHPPTDHAHYPCLFDWTTPPTPLHQIQTALAQNAYDLILYTDVRAELSPEITTPILDAAQNTPIYLLDAEDDPIDHTPTLQQNLAPHPITATFKREMLMGYPYAPNTIPMPFACPNHLINPSPAVQRTRPVFWAGHRQFGLRRLYLEHIESHFNLDLTETFTPAQYHAALNQSQIALSFFGFGFDTVRYWEIPAHGAMLLAERLPIHIPHPFTDGHNALHFDDLSELQDKLTYALSHPEITAQIATRGHQHLLAYHTATARARQLLSHIQQFIPSS